MNGLKDKIEGLRIRILITVYYCIVWGLEIHRIVTGLSRRSFQEASSLLYVAMFAAFVLVSLWLFGSLSKKLDRAACLLYGVFYALRIGAYFAKGINPLALECAACVIVSAGMTMMIVGLIR